MLLRLLTLLFINLSALTFASEWPLGRFVLPVADIKLSVTIDKQDEQKLFAQVAWPASKDMGLMAGATSGPFELLNEQTARFYFSKQPLDYFELELKESGALWLRYFSEPQPSLSTYGRLIEDIQPALDFSELSTEQALRSLPELQVWPTYVNENLWPFWSGDSAKQFSTSRCNDGSLPNHENLCWELRAHWLAEGLDKNYTRMLSRQIYTYGAIFHLTGEPSALTLMHQGIEILRQRIQSNGSVIAIVEADGTAQTIELASAQDLAYAQLGLAMAFYLTGDQAILSSLEKVKNYIFSQYKNEGLLRWTLAGENEPGELVALLDQLNAYMLLVLPLLPEDLKARWQSDTQWLVEAMLKHFHLTEQNRFAGQLINGQPNQAGERHNDFGHSVKAYWMILIAAQLLDRPEWIALAEQGIAQITKQAFRFHRYHNEFSTWGNQANSHQSAWWEYAELTQASATLALSNTEYVRYLPESYRGWFGQYVDAEQGGVWMFAGGGPKQHLWKNGYHETELAIVAYITTALIKDQPFSLFYADSQTQFKPYFYSAPVAQAFDIGLGRQRVIFGR